MPISTLQIIGALTIAMATTAALPTCSKDDSATAESPSATSTAALVTTGPGLPADFPLPPGLSPCKPLVASGEIICEWHGQDGRAIYKFYLAALPKAGYTLIRAKEEPPPDYNGVLGLGFKKGKAQGAVTIARGDLTIQYLPGQ